MDVKEIRRKIRIGVIGGSKAGHKFLDLAHEVGVRIAKEGAILVCGGLAGVMSEAARGARENDGLTIGILPGHDPEAANPFIDVPIATGLGYSRNSLVAMNADALIAVDGEYGTLSEIAYGKIYSKPVIGLGTWDIKGVVETRSPRRAVKLAIDAAKADAKL